MNVLNGAKALFNKAKGGISPLPLDKWLHFLAGMGVFLLVSFYSSVGWGLALTYVAGFAKEGIDQYRYQGADWGDVVATVTIPTIITIIHALL